MVIPLHAKEAWLPVLSGRSEFVPGPGPMLVIAPHPDDEALAVGGLIAIQRQAGRRVTLIAVTDGENAYEDSTDLRAIRIREQTSAAECLGVPAESIVRLAITDSSVATEYDQLLVGLAKQINANTHIVAPWPYDFHPDHEACGRAATHLALQAGARLSFYFFWTWHLGCPDLLRDLPISLLPLSAAQQAKKADALAMHVSQLRHPSGDPILHEEHLWPARLPFEVYLPA